MDSEDDEEKKKPLDFQEIMKQAAYLKGEQLKSERKVFDRYPCYIQHSLYYYDNPEIKQCESLKDRINLANQFKIEGNSLFHVFIVVNIYNQEEKYTDSVMRYEKALTLFDYLETKTPNWRRTGIFDKDITFIHIDREPFEEEIDEIVTSCLSNASLSYFNNKEYKECIECCDGIIETHPDNSKAFYRRAMARITPLSSGATEYELGIKDLKEAYRLNPKDSQINNKYHTIITNYNNQKKKDKEQFDGLFKRGNIVDENEINGKEDDKDKKESDDQKIKRIKAELDYCQKIANDYRKIGKIADAERMEKEIEDTRIKLYLYTEKKKQEKDKIHIDFDNPSKEMVELGKRYGFDLSDPETRKLLADIQDDSENSYDVDDDDETSNNNYGKHNNSDIKRRYMDKEMNDIDEKQVYIPADWGCKEIKSFLESEGYDTKNMNEVHLRKLANIILKDEIENHDKPTKKKRWSSAAISFVVFFTIFFCRSLYLTWKMMKD